MQFVRGGLDPTPNARLTWAGVFLIVALAWAAGAVNALGYLLLGGVFTSHMTGNTSDILLAFISGHGRASFGRLAALAGFFGGAVAGAVLIETHPKQSSARALGLEAVLLGAMTSLLWNSATASMLY